MLHSLRNRQEVYAMKYLKVFTDFAIAIEPLNDA